MGVNERIRQIRREKKINQIKIAEKLGITVQSYSMKETGRRPITTDELKIIADALNVPIKSLFD